MEKIISLDKRSSKNITKIMKQLYAKPVVTIKSLQQTTDLTRPKIVTAIEKLIELDVLQEKKLGREKIYRYERYINIFR